MVTIKTGDDPGPDIDIPEYEQPDYYKTKLVFSVLFAGLTGAVCWPTAAFYWAFIYVCKHVASLFGINTGWRSYYYTLALRLAVAPLKAFDWLLIPDEFHRDNPFIPEDYKENLEDSQ